MDAHSAHFQATLQAIIAGLLGWTFFSLGDVIMKWMAANFDTALIQLVSGAIGLLMGLAMFYIRNRGRSLYTKHWKLHIIRGFLIGFGAIFIINGISRLPLAQFYCIIFLNPMTVTLFSFLLLKEKISVHQIISIIIGFIGVVIVAGPEIIHLNIGVFFMFGAVILLSLNIIVVRMIGHEEPVSFHMMSTFFSIMFFNLFLFGFNFIRDPSIISITPDFAAVVIMTILFFAGQICFVIAFSRAPSTSVIAPFHYSQIVLGVIFGYFFFGDLPTATTWIGGGLIVFAGFYLIFREHQSYLRSRNEAALQAH